MRFVRGSDLGRSRVQQQLRQCGPSENPTSIRSKFLERFPARAYQAYYEHMPLRLRHSSPKGRGTQLYRRVGFGRLAEFDVLDTRQYRTDQPCGDRTRPPCERRCSDPQATALGARARAMAATPDYVEVRSRWNVLAQQIMMARVDRLPVPSLPTAWTNGPATR